MIKPADIEFPNNVIALVAARVQSYCDPSPDPGDPRVQVFRRMLRPSDPTQSVGVFPLIKRPDPRSHEIGQGPEPTLKRYHFVMQTVVQDTDEAACLSVHSILSNRLWRMFYRDSILNAALTELAIVADNSHERIQRRGIEQTRYVSNEITGTFIQTSWIECWIETETVGI